MKELHIISCIVRTTPLELAAVKDHINALPGCEVLADDASGKLVVVMEGLDTPHLMAHIDDIRAQPGVHSVSLVYQHAELETVMKEHLPCP